MAGFKLGVSVMYIGDYLGRRNIYTPEALAIVDYGKSPEWRLTYRELNRRANRFANFLRDRVSVSKGDRVAILARDGVEHLDCFYACGKLGAIHTAFNWRLHWRELAGLVELTQPKVLIYSDDFKQSVADIRRALPGGKDPIQKYLHIEGGLLCPATRSSPVCRQTLAARFQSADHR